MCHDTARRLQLLLLLALTGFLLPLNAYALTVCVSDFNNSTRFCSFDPLPDNLAFYMKGAPGVEVIDRWRVRGEVTPAQSVEGMIQRAKSLGADVLVFGTVKEDRGKVVSELTAYRVADASGEAFQFTVEDPLDCRDAASKATVTLMQHLGETKSEPAEKAVFTVSSSLRSVDLHQVISEQRALAERSMRSRKSDKAKPEPAVTSTDAVTEYDFARVIARLANKFKISYDKVFIVTNPDAVVTVGAAAEAFSRGIQTVINVEGDRSAALTRADLAQLLTKCFPAAEGMPEKENNDRPTGLVIDARGFGMERSINPIIQSEDGTKIFPDAKHLPSLDYIEDKGIASFVNDMMKAPRAGDNPLVIKVIGVKGSASNIAVVSRSDADRILKAAQNSDFIREWKVTFLLDQGY